MRYYLNLEKKLKIETITKIEMEFNKIEKGE